MRHQKSFNHLSRKSGHRKAMLANMASSLIMHKRIKTTTAKAKALRVFVEPLITKSKEDSTHSRRVVFSYLKDKEAVSELFREVSTKVENRPGGYTRILKLGNRLGDNAEMCIIELVDYNETLLTAKTETKQKTTRRRRGAKKKTDQPEIVTKTEKTLVAEEETEKDEIETKPAVDEHPDEAEIPIKSKQDESNKIIETSQAEAKTDEEVKNESKEDNKADSDEIKEDKES